MSTYHNKTLTVESAAAALSRLTTAERHLLECAATRGWVHGGLPVDESVREIALEEGLIYRSTGRLRPIPLRLLGG